MKRLLLLFALLLIGASLVSAQVGTPIQITTTQSQIPEGTVNQSYSFTFTATGGSGSYNWSVTAGALPAGYFLSPSGTISGTTATTGSFAFTVQAIDAQVTSLTASASFT